MRGPETDDPKIIRDEASGKIPSWNEEENDLGDESWSWEPPDLQVNDSWYQARVKTLSAAIHDLPEADQLYQQGLEALERHRLNYTDEGSK
jgi:hypothetical protein